MVDLYSLNSLSTPHYTISLVLQILIIRRVFYRGFGGGMGPRFGRAPARAYDEYLKAYSTAMLPGRERENVSYGGKSTL